MTVQYFMLQIEDYHITFSAAECQGLIGRIEDWLKSPTEYYVVLIKDLMYETYTCPEPLKAPEQKLYIYFAEIERLWCCSIEEITEMLKHTHASLQNSTHDSIAWHLNNIGMYGSEFDYPTSEYVN